MDNPLLWQVGVGVLTLFFFFLIYMFTKTWRWLHVTVTFFVFGAAIALMVYVSITLKTHDAWRRMVVAQEKQVAQLEEERKKLLHGDLKLLDQPEDTLRDLQARRHWVMVDVGRVWEHSQPSPAAPDGTVTVSTVPPGAAGGAAPPNRIDPETVLYVFVEGPVPPPLAPTLTTTTAPTFPQYYIGEFTVTAATDTTVTLRPTMPITNYERAMMNIPGTTWALYESMPVDGHKLLAVDPFANPDLTKNADEEPVFGTMNSQFLTLLLARAAKRQDETDEEFLARYAAIIDAYQRDGKRAAPDDLPDNTWLKVRFLENHEENVDILTESSLSVMSSEDFFDHEGLAEIAVLRRDEPAKFKKGDVGVFTQDAANRLIGLGVAELVEPVFVRSLNRYDATLREISHEMRRLNYEIVQAQRNAADIAAAIGRIQEAATYREQDKAKLEQDIAKFQYERDQIEKYRNQLKSHVAQEFAELSRLYRENSELEAELDRLSRAISDEVNARTRQAIANTP